MIRKGPLLRIRNFLGHFRMIVAPFRRHDLATLVSYQKHEAYRRPRKPLPSGLRPLPPIPRSPVWFKWTETEVERRKKKTQRSGNEQINDWNTSRPTYCFPLSSALNGRLSISSTKKINCWQWRRNYRARKTGGACPHFYNWLGMRGTQEQTRNWPKYTDRHESAHQND